MIIFGLGSAIVVFEVNRQAVNKELKVANNLSIHNKVEIDI